MAELTLGERVFVVREPSLRRAMAWRARLKEAVGPVLPALMPLLPSLAPGTAVELSEETAATLGAQLAPLLLDGPDLVVELALEFWSIEGAEREYVLDHATDRQVFRAFVEALGAAYPFGALLAAWQAPTPAQPLNGSAPQPAGSMQRS
jgi:hypothetical protein